MSTAPAPAPVVAATAAQPPGGAGNRIRELLPLIVAGLLSLAAGLAVSLEAANLSLIGVIGIALAALLIAVLVASSRYEVSLALIALYLGLIEGPVKLLTSAGAAASASRDVLIIAVSLGAVVRILAKGERVRLPPMSGWVLAFIALTLVESLNPATQGITKSLGGFRQQLEWLPLFFFGYLLMRSRQRLHKYFVLLGVLALANGVVGAYEAHIGPAALASLGPGYAELVEGGGKKGQGGRGYVSEGVARIRPPALGSDSGFGGTVGALSLPVIMALLVTVRGRKRWLVGLLCLGALVAVVSAAARTMVIGAVVAALAFALLSFRAGSVRRPLTAVLVVAGLACATVLGLVAIEGQGVLARYSSIATPEQAETVSVHAKGGTLLHIPNDLEHAPFGSGLSTTGAASGFGGLQTSASVFSGRLPANESQYNAVAVELGVLGLLLYLALTIKLITLVLRRLRHVADVALRVDLAGVFAGVFAIAVMGLSGPTTYTSPSGPFFWFAAGIAAYWLAGPGMARRTGRAPRTGMAQRNALAGAT